MKQKSIKNVILGTGVIPYNTPSESILAVKNYLDSIISC